MAPYLDTNDSGTGFLRQTVIDANTTAAADTINSTVGLSGCAVS